MITQLKDDQGQWCSCNYFSDLFTSRGIIAALILNSVCRKITDDQNNFLLMPSTAPEIKDAIFSMRPAQTE